MTDDLEYAALIRCPACGTTDVSCWTNTFNNGWWCHACKARFHESHRPRSTFRGRLVKRFRLAYRFRIWPWQVSAEAVKYLTLRPVNAADIARTHELAQRMGWKV